MQGINSWPYGASQIVIVGLIGPQAVALGSSHTLRRPAKCGPPRRLKPNTHNLVVRSAPSRLRTVQAISIIYYSFYCCAMSTERELFYYSRIVILQKFGSPNNYSSSFETPNSGFGPALAGNNLLIIYVCVM